MVITMKEILSDVFEHYPGDMDSFAMQELYRYVNQAYIEVRDRWIQRGQSEEFAISQSLDSFTESNFQYFNQASLSREVLQSFPLDQAIIATFVRTVPELTDAYSIGKTFDPGDVRSYHPGNGLKYFEGDVVVENGEYFRAKETLYATSTDPLVDQVEWEPVYWMKKGVGMLNAEIIDYTRVDRHKVVIDSDSAVITALKDTLFTSKNIKYIDIEYIPEHQNITEFSGEFRLPDRAVYQLRNLVVSNLIPQDTERESQLEPRETSDE